MTTNFGGCEERRTMAAQPSAHNEDRHLLRQLAWERRNQETSQAKESNCENVPLFGEPYKTNKGDELSNRIQRMLGRYEDVNSPGPVAMEPLPIPSYGTPLQSDRSETSTDLKVKPPLLSEIQRTASSSQTGPSSGSNAPQVSPEPHGNAPSSSSHPGQPQQQKVEAQSNLREHADLFQGVSSQSPDAVAEALPGLRFVKQDITEPNTVDPHLPQGPKQFPSEFPGAVDVPTFNPKQSPRDPPVPPANKGNVLPAQTFSSLLSKPPSVVMTQKPTAYVRPMDGQDQVVSESPELKPSPEPYEPLPELINKTQPDKEKMPTQYLETKTSNALCVEDILREMTCSWPPVLTAISSPSRAETSKSPLATKEVQRLSLHPEQKKLVTSPANLPRPVHESSSLSLDVAHSRVGRSPSSSDSGSSSRSESDSESVTARQPQNPANISPAAPGAIQVDWQLGNWIRPSQHNSGTQGPRSSHPSQSPAHKQPEPSQKLTPASLEVAEPTKGRGNPQSCDKTSQDCHKQQSHPTAPSADPSGCSSKRSSAAASSKAAKADCVDAALFGKHGDVAAALTKQETHLLDGHKAETKSRHHKKKKEKPDDARDSRRPSKHKAHAKQKAAAEPKAQPGQLPLPSPLKNRCSKLNSASTSRKASKSPPRTTQKHRTKTGPNAQGSQGATKALMVTIDLRLLSRVPQISGNHHHHGHLGQEEAASKVKRSKAELQDPGGAGSKLKAAKTSRKTALPHGEADCNIPRKKPRLENSCTSPSHASAKREVLAEKPELKKVKKEPSQKESKSQKRTSREVGESSKEAHKKKDSCKKKRSSNGSVKLEEQLQSGKEILKSSSFSFKPREPALSRPPLKSEDWGPHPVTHYIKEAKKLKHKADAERDKSRKAFSYLEAAMYFVESGIAMENDPHISRSSYTMFADTVDLLKFVLTNVVDTSPPFSEKDFFKLLCLKCQSLLHMAMFHQKHKTALKYSKTLTSHFNNSAQRTHPHPTVSTPRVSDTPSPLSSTPSPAVSSNGGSGVPSDPGGSVSLPLAIHQTAFSYVSITTLFLNAHDTWEQAEEAASRCSGMLRDVDAAVGPLSLTSSMTSMVRYTRQAVKWLRLHSQKGK